MKEPRAYPASAVERAMKVQEVILRAIDGRLKWDPGGGDPVVPGAVTCPVGSLDVTGFVTLGRTRTSDGRRTTLLGEEAGPYQQPDILTCYEQVIPCLTRLPRTPIRGPPV
jgi:hypothetical protein